MVLVALIALFVAGLMVGRTPEYLGKQLTVPEMKLIALYAIIGPFFVLGLTAVAVVTDAGRAGLTANTGAHGLSEILAAYTSSMANNGQNLAGLNANSAFYNTSTALAMVAGRFELAIPGPVRAAGPEAAPRRSDPDRHAAVCRPGDRRGARRRRPERLPGARPGPRRRASAPVIGASSWIDRAATLIRTFQEIHRARGST